MLLLSNIFIYLAIDLPIIVSVKVLQDGYGYQYAKFPHHGLSVPQKCACLKMPSIPKSTNFMELEFAKGIRVCSHLAVTFTMFFL